MGHQLVGRNSIPLEGFGGIISIANAADLPENACPRNWDVDFTIGGFQQRDGLYSALTSGSLYDFLYAKTFQQPSGQINTIALNRNGVLWAENVNSSPGTLSSIFGGINIGSYMSSSTDNNREYMCFSQITDPSSQGDIPRQWAGSGDTNFDRISQVAPGISPSFNSSLSAGSAANITAWSISGNTVTFTANNNFVAGEIVTISGLVTGSFMNGKTFTISGTGLSTTQFEVAFAHGTASASETGLATPQYSYPLTSIIQNTANPLGAWNSGCMWSDGPNSSNPGNVITIFYAVNTTYPLGDQILNAAFNTGNPVYVYIKGSPFGNGTQLVISVGQAKPPGAGYDRWYFTFAADSSNFQYQSSAPGASYQITQATITAASPIPNLGVGNQIQISGASVAGWNSTWTITQSLSGYTLAINSTSMTNYVGKYYFSYVSGGTNGAPPTTGQLAGQLVTVTNTLNGNGVFNVIDTAIITNATDGGGQYFTVGGFNVGAVPSQVETGATATTSGTIFQIDPGFQDLGTSIVPIFGNSSGGFATLVGGNSSQFPLTAGTRNGVCLYITRNGAVTPASIPVTFVTTAQSNFIYANNIPIGPPDVIGRIIAITEAGANGLPGQYYYYIPVPVKSVLNNASVTYSSTVVQDNTTTSAKFTFDDNTLLSATEIDITGLNYFSIVELGNSAWNVVYGNRVFYGLVQNKIYNLINMSFDGGYSQSANPLPAGWGIDVGSNPSAGNPAVITAFAISGGIATFQCANNFDAGQQVQIDGFSTGTYLNGIIYTVLAAGLTSTQFEASTTHGNVGITADSGIATPLNIPGTLLNPTQYSYGNSYYVRNTTGTTQSVFGMLTQSAFQDYYGVNILNPQVTYGVRVTCRCPAGQASGNLIVDLTTNNTATYGFSGYGVTYGATYEAYVIPFNSMSQTEWITFQGGLLTVPFQSRVPSTLLLRLWAQNVPYGGDVEVKKVEVYPLSQPLGFPQDAIGVIGSYIGKPEAFDINTGVISLSQGNQQQCYGAVVFNGILFFLKEESIVSTSQTAGQEPGNWAVTPVTDKVGACGIYAYDKSKEYAVMACRAGLFVFNGGEPACINWEIRDIWNALNWSAGRTIWVKNDVVNHKIYVGVPLPTPNKWLPNAPANAAPATPNVILMCNYLGLETFNELAGEAGMHTTMFGTLADIDMRRKWTIWNIPSPNGAFLVRPNIIDKPLFVCNGNQSGKIYGLSSAQLTDDGAWIDWDYCTYGFTNPAKAKENPLLGFHRKRYTKMQVTASGSGSLNIDLLIDDIVNPLDTFSVWNKPSLNAAELDYVRNLNIGGNRAFVELSSGGLGTTANIARVILVGNADLHAPMPSIPGR